MVISLMLTAWSKDFVPSLVWFCVDGEAFKSYFRSVRGLRLSRLRTKVWVVQHRGLREDAFDRRCYARLRAVLCHPRRSPGHPDFRSLEVGALRRLAERLILRRALTGLGPRLQYVALHWFPRPHRLR